ncbi:LLM class flavin-dependent oxidoreductase [Pseudonocardia endophytica]|uniref:LLM class flavin-dependent oxidoreductase n=1 Tax=Pseudonocardia endophytica TaxID=401976 RepID=UPI002436D8DF|nr:LLM class flavin-dependent oxidoreductase [Pseudonocardia endophytica]
MPTVRYHPAIIAQAAATTALLSDGRFVLGVGSGERLSEHVTGAEWPVVGVRQRMLRDAGVLGRGLPGTTVVVLDDDGTPVIDQVGELAQDRHHTCTMLEYWGRPEATAEKFLGDWLLTGDLATQDADGYVWSTPARTT